jgi:hypothetical protein
MTCHDRDFMNRIVTKVVEIDGGETVTYSGNYDFYEKERDPARVQARGRLRAPAGDAREGAALHRALPAHAAKAAQVQSRVKKLEKIETIELPKKRAVVRFDFKAPPARATTSSILEKLSKGTGTARLYDGLRLPHPPHRALVRHGRQRRRKIHAAEDGRGHAPARRRLRALGASVKLGYFSQQALDVLDPELTVSSSRSRRTFRGAGLGVLRSLVGAFQFSATTSTRRSVPLGRREVAPRHGAHALRPAELPRPRRADEPPRPRDEGDARRDALEVRGDDALRLPRPRLPARALEPRPRPLRERLVRPAARLRRLVRGVGRPLGTRGSRASTHNRPMSRATFAAALAALAFSPSPAPSGRASRSGRRPTSRLISRRPASGATGPGWSRTSSTPSS